MNKQMMPPVNIQLKESNIIDTDAGLMLRCEPELIEDVKSMYGIDLADQQLLSTVLEYGRLTISVKKEETEDKNMGMPGMTNEAATAYAVAGTKAREQQAETSNSKMTVAEFRNKINYITHYYDSYLFDNFIKDQSIAAKDKLAVVFGQFVVDALYDNGDVNADTLIKLMKTMTDNIKESM